MIERSCLPGYGPEPNLEERLNADLKHATGSKVPARTPRKLRVAANDPMAMLEVNPEHAASCSQDPKVGYAA